MRPTPENPRDIRVFLNGHRETFTCNHKLRCKVTLQVTPKVTHKSIQLSLSGIIMSNAACDDEDITQAQVLKRRIKHLEAELLRLRMLQAVNSIAHLHLPLVAVWPHPATCPCLDCWKPVSDLTGPGFCHCGPCEAYRHKHGYHHNVPMQYIGCVNGRVKQGCPCGDNPLCPCQPPLPPCKK